MIRIQGADKNSTINEKTSSKGLAGTYHLADNTNLYEIQRSNNFEFVVSGLSDSYQDVIRLSVTSCPIPHFKQGTIEVKRGNNTLKYAGTPSFDSGTIKVNDFIGANTKEVLMYWQSLSYNIETEKVGLASDYKKQCRLVEYSPDYQPVRTWLLRGCWISSISEDDYNSENNEKHQITATIEYDSAIIEESNMPSPDLQ